MFPFQQYVVTKEVPLQRIIENKEKLPWSVYVGVAGMPGATAYMAWKEFASPKSGETTFVTTGAGPVSSVVIQLAKADGQKVIASAGSDDKVEYMKSIGADVAFNYKKTKTVEVLEKEGRVNIYWDNVGGEVLEATLDNAAQYARFIECGMITAYNEEAYHIKKLLRIVEFEIKLFGFIVTSLFAKYPEFYTEFPKLIADGKIKYTEDITVGLENTGKAILAVQKGTNTGKSVIVVSQSIVSDYAKF